MSESADPISFAELFILAELNALLNLEGVSDE